MIDHYTTGLAIIFSVMGPGLELSYITLARKKLSLFEPAGTNETINGYEKDLKYDQVILIREGF
jgi:hypothetical protein